MYEKVCKKQVKGASRRPLPGPARVNAWSGDWCIGVVIRSRAASIGRHIFLLGVYLSVFACVIYSREA